MEQLVQHAEFVLRLRVPEDIFMAPGLGIVSVSDTWHDPLPKSPEPQFEAWVLVVCPVYCALVV